MTTIRRLPKDPGPAAWAEILPERKPSPPLEGQTTTDWLVIGAGFAGLAAAWRLSQLAPDDRITILEATGLAHGPAGRNSGFMIDLPHDLSSADYGGALDHDRATIADNRRAIAFARDMAQAADLDPTVFAPVGKTNAAATDQGLAHNARYAQHLTNLGEEHSLLDAQDMRAMTGIPYYQGGLFTPGTVILQPAAYVRGIAAGLRSNRIALHEHSPVLSLARTNTWVATTPKGQISAPCVILAVNGHLTSFGFAQGRLMPVFTYASMTRPLTEPEIARLGGQMAWGVTPADPMGTTVRRITGDGGDRIVIRNRFTYDPRMEVSQARLNDVARDHDRSFAARFPMLSDVTMDYRWGGRLCLSRNGVQVIGELEPGLFSACCQNGLGTVRGTLAGLLAAEQACGVASPALTRALAAAPPRRLPPEPLTWLGANARMRWSEWRAGREL